MRDMLMRFFTMMLFCCSLAFAQMGQFALVEGAKAISLGDTEKLISEKNAVIFDVNTQEVRESAGYLKDAIFLDFNDQASWAKSLPSDKKANLIFYCLNRLCYEASFAAVEVQKMGYENAYAMMDGIEGWINSARPFEKKGVLDWQSAQNVHSFTDGVHNGVVFGEIPSCRDCHGATVLGSKTLMANNAADKMQINKNCVSCHKDLSSQFEDSVHKVNYDALLRGVTLFDNKTDKGKKRPLCVDCHTTHTESVRGVHSPKQMTSFSCAKCHEGKGKSFTATFHGKANLLGLVGQTPVVASCADCHGGHNVFKSDHIKSTLSTTNRVNTCAKCHDGATASFAEYIAHADHTDSEKFPGLHATYIFMTGLLVSVFVFFGIHTLLWACRLLILKSRYPNEWASAKAAAHSDSITIRRFGLYHRIQHFFVAASFLGLSVSGIAQKFYDAPWAQSIIDMLGGPINAAYIHHISAIVMGVVFGLHVLEIFVRAWINRDAVRDESGKLSLKKALCALFGPDSLMPNWQDFRDIKDNFKWFLGLGERPQFDRWTYWEKFDYLAVFWGMFIIGISGLILWFPVAFSHILPGAAINVAFIFHSDEALLAMGFIFAIHFFNTHFRPDRFPIDMVIFSGAISQSEAKHERVKWLDRLKASGKLDKLVQNSKDFGLAKFIGAVVGIVVVGIGLVLLALMIYAGLFS